MNERDLMNQAQKLIDTLGWDEEGRPTEFLVKAFHHDLLSEAQMARLQEYVTRNEAYDLLADNADDDWAMPEAWLDRAREIERAALEPEAARVTMASAERMIDLSMGSAEPDIALPHLGLVGSRADDDPAAIPSTDRRTVSEVFALFEGCRRALQKLSDDEWVVLRALFEALIGSESKEQRKTLELQWKSSWRQLSRRHGELNEGDVRALWARVRIGLDALEELE